MHAVLERVAFVSEELRRLANPARAPGMARYLHTDMPCLGVPRPALVQVLREARARWPLTGPDDYRRTVLELHALPHREEQYAAIHYARHSTRFVTGDHVDLYRTMIVDGAWWDLVDDFAHVLCRLLLQDPARIGPVLDAWLDDDVRWLRRIAILSQLDAKDRTDEARLFGACERRAHEREFFIRKAIGWALRQYARTAPDVVLAWCLAHRNTLSGLSFREATKHLTVPSGVENPQKD